MAEDVEGTDALDLVEPTASTREAVQETLEAGVRGAPREGGGDARGEIDRKPNRDRCPDWCRYQAICRLERSLGTEEPPSSAEGENGR